MLSPALTAEFARLNARQREAVEHPDGPVLVVAGPGTGKTQLLAARVAWLLQQPDARPQEILCLTYTEAAARNMRERLLRFLGPAAHQVAIHTFHSFGQLVIHENEDLLGHHGLTVASELEIAQVLRELIDNLPAGHLLRRDVGEVYYETNRLQPMLQDLKRESWSPAHVLQALETYRTGLGNNADLLYSRTSRDGSYKKGDLMPGPIAAEDAKLALTAAAVGLFDAYQAALRQRGRYDYDDMLGWATVLLTDHSHLLLGYQERFQHFLVDEYQDTNGAQARLLHLLASYWDCPSVMVVGDDDQSIFRFQGASVANLLAFRQRYPTARVVVLEENYRSSAAVLAAAEALIDHNQERLTRQFTDLPGFTKRLLARHPHFADSPVAAPVLRYYATPLHEAAHVAAEVAALHRAGWPAGGGAILARNHAQLDVVAQLLAAAGMPFFRQKKINVLAEEGFAKSLHRALHYLAAAHALNPAVAEPALFVLLHLECLAIPPADLVQLAAGHRLRQAGTDWGGRATALPWRTWVAQAVSNDTIAAELQLTPPGRAALQRALAVLDQWVHAAASQPVPALLELICLQTLLPWHLPRHARPEHLLAVTRALLRFGQDETRRHPNLSVSDFVAVWDATALTPKGLPLEQTAGTDTDTLQLLTAHGAKGLEFERVWLIGCQANTWIKTDRRTGFFLPPALFGIAAQEGVGTESKPTTKKARQEQRTEKNRRIQAEEARRLFFVALTRAQEHLTLSVARVDEAGTSSPECQFVTELCQKAGVPATEILVDAAVVAAAQYQLLAPPLTPVPRPAPALLDRVLANFALSASTLNAYLTCPVGFYYEQLLRAPTASTAPLLFGSAVHEALEHHFRQTQRPEAAGLGAAGDLVAAFDTSFARVRSLFSPADYDRRRHAGQEQLRAYHARHATTWQVNAVVEHSVTGVTPGGISLKGSLDRLDPRGDGQGHDIVDYKTGNPDYAEASLLPAPYNPAATLSDWLEDRTQRGGDYWRQGIFYHLLIRYDTERRFRPALVHFDFTRPVKVPGKADEYKRYTLHITPEDEGMVLAQIAAVDGAIRAHEFDRGCGECAWCALRA